MTPRSATTRCPLHSITSSAQLEMRGRILTAAKLRFARFGHEETALSDIARLAGVPEKAVRKHFEDVMAVMVALQRSLERRPTARGPRPKPGFRTRGNRFASARDVETAGVPHAVRGRTGNVRPGLAELDA